MENSDIRAKYVLKTYSGLEDIENISEISDLVKDYKFGDLVKFGITYAIGKDGNLISCTDSNLNISIPYQITGYLDDAINKYSEIDVTFIQLRHDDKFILNNINDEDNIIQEDWGWQIYWGRHGVIVIFFPDGKKGTFTITNTTTSGILQWIEASKEEQFNIKLIAHLKDNDGSYQSFVRKYGKANTRWAKIFPEQLPSTWTVKKAYIDGSKKRRYMDFDYRLGGPKRNKEDIIKIINNFYQGFDYHIENIE